MLIGIFADSHDHLDHIRRAVDVFNDSGCELVVFAGDLVSSFAVPPLRALKCKVIGCFGDNEGNKPGVAAGMRIIGTIGEPPFGFKTADGRKVVLTHMDRSLRDIEGEIRRRDFCPHSQAQHHSRRVRPTVHSTPVKPAAGPMDVPQSRCSDTTTMEAKIVWLNENR